MPRSLFISLFLLPSFWPFFDFCCFLFLLPSFCSFWLIDRRTCYLTNFSTSELHEVLRNLQFFSVFTCASCHSGMQFFDIGASKNVPKLPYFVHFHFQMYFSPQWRAIFRHRNFKECSETAVFYIFSLPNVLLATAACNFSRCQVQKVLRSWRVLYSLTWKCASRHSGMQFFDIGTSKNVPKLPHFIYFHFQMCFSPQRRAIFRDVKYKKCFGADVFCTVWLGKMCFSPQRRTIFRHLKYKKRFGADMFCTFWLGNVLLATVACNFWFLLWPHESAPAALTGLLFDWPDTGTIKKKQNLATSLTFGADVSSFF